QTARAPSRGGGWIDTGLGGRPRGARAGNEKPQPRPVSDTGRDAALDRTTGTGLRSSHIGGGDAACQLTPEAGEVFAMIPRCGARPRAATGYRPRVVEGNRGRARRPIAGLV